MQPFTWEEFFAPKIFAYMYLPHLVLLVNFPTVFKKTTILGLSVSDLLDATRQKQDWYFLRKKGNKGTLLIWLLQLFYKYIGKLFSLFFVIY